MAFTCLPDGSSPVQTSEVSWPIDDNVTAVLRCTQHELELLELASHYLFFVSCRKF